MAIRPVKRCSTSLVIAKCKLKLQWDTSTHQLKCLGKKKIQAQTNQIDKPEFWRGGQSKWTVLAYSLGSWKLVQLLCKSLLYKVRHALTTGPVIAFLLMKEKGNLNLDKIVVQMFITALFIMITNWKQPREYSLRAEWINNLWFI